MQRDIDGGLRGDYETKDYYHNLKIDQIFTKARKIAWAQIMNDPRIQLLISQEQQAKVKRFKKKQQTQNILAIPK